MKILLLPIALLLLTGCGSDPADAVRADVAALTEAANAQDADLVRDRAEALMSTVAAQREADQISADEAERLAALAKSVRTNADVVDADLIERRRIEAEAEATAKQLEEAKKQLEEERKKAEEAAKKGKGKDEEEAKDDD